MYDVSLVAQAFQVKLNSGSGELILSDQLDTPIRDVSTLKYAIDVWSKSGCFYLKVEFQEDKSELITSEVMICIQYVFLTLHNGRVYLYFILYFAGN